MKNKLYNYDVKGHSDILFILHLNNNNISTATQAILPCWSDPCFVKNKAVPYMPYS